VSEPLHNARKVTLATKTSHYNVLQWFPDYHLTLLFIASYKIKPLF